MSEIQWYGHSAFGLHCNGVHVLIDPFFAQGSAIAAQDIDRADVVLVTHDHADHVGDAVSICRRTGAMLGAEVGTAGKLAEAGVPLEQIINGIGFNMGGTVEHKGVRMTMVPAFHSSESGVPAGYIVQMPDGLTVYHAGDTCIFSGMVLWGRLYHIDVALLPIGGVFTMDARQAAMACTMLRCKQVVPMHWGTFPVIAQSPADFEEELKKLDPDCRCVTMRAGESRTFQRLPEEEDPLPTR